MFARTGIFQQEKIDDRDLKTWTYINGSIEGTSEFTLAGTNDTCWLLIHSYTSTPREMSALAHTIHETFADTIHAIRLSGHGETPSRLLDKTLDVWYLEVEQAFIELQNKCDKVNVVGSSFGATLALRLAENKDFNHLYLLNTFLFTPFRKLFILTDSFTYAKKYKIAPINKP